MGLKNIFLFETVLFHGINHKFLQNDIDFHFIAKLFPFPIYSRNVPFPKFRFNNRRYSKRNIILYLLPIFYRFNKQYLMNLLYLEIKNGGRTFRVEL